MRRPPLRSAFTLMELLVVTAILLTLFSIVVTGARPSRTADGDIRRGAQQLASILLASQSSSLGSPTGAAVIIDSAGDRGEMISHARRFPFIEGRVTAGMPPADPTAWQVQVQLAPTNDSVAALEHGYRIRFLERTDGDQGPPSDWFAFVSTSPPAAEVRFRVENGQTPQTTVWPTAPESGGSLSFQVARYPIPNGLSQLLPSTVAIDLRHSGYGDETLTAWKSLADRGAIAVGFDKVGAVDALMQNVLPAESEARSIQPLTPSERIYFFVTLKNDILDPTVNALANEDALWVVINPRSGNIAISPNVPQPVDDATALRAARDKARRGITIGG